MFIAALFTTAKTWNSSEMLNRLNKENVIHIHYGTLHSHKKRLYPLQGNEAGNHYSQQTDTGTKN